MSEADNLKIIKAKDFNEKIHEVQRTRNGVFGWTSDFRNFSNDQPDRLIVVREKPKAWTYKFDDDTDEYDVSENDYLAFTVNNINDLEIDRLIDHLNETEFTLLEVGHENSIINWRTDARTTLLFEY